MVGDVMLGLWIVDVVNGLWGVDGGWGVCDDGFMGGKSRRTNLEYGAQ